MFLVTYILDPIFIYLNDYNSNDPPLINFCFARNDDSRSKKKKKISNSWVLAWKNEVKVIPSNFDPIFIHLNDYNSNDPPLINFLFSLCFVKNDRRRRRRRKRKKISNLCVFAGKNFNDTLIFIDLNDYNSNDPSLIWL